MDFKETIKGFLRLLLMWTVESALFTIPLFLLWKFIIVTFFGIINIPFIVWWGILIIKSILFYDASKYNLPKIFVNLPEEIIKKLKE